MCRPLPIQPRGRLGMMESSGKRKRRSTLLKRSKLHKQTKEEDVSVEDVDTTFDAESANKEELPMEEAHGIENQEPENEEWESGTEDTAGVDHSVTGDVESGVGSSGSSTVKRSKISGLYKPPTREELQTLKETQTLFKSNLMRLQIAELMSEVKPSKKVTSSLEELLHSLKETLVSLPSTETVNVCDGLSLLSKKIQYPPRLDITKMKGKFHFVPPTGVKVVGSYLLGAMTKPGISVDLALHIPQECLQAKDHLNYRYFHKRALFLSIVAGHLRKRKKQLSITSVKFSCAHGNPLLPIIILESEKVKVHLFTSISNTTLFKPTRFTPDRNHVRRNFLNSSISSDESDNLGPPTPHYNAAMLSELGAKERHLHDVYAATQECPGVVDAVVMCKVWARQRGLDQGYGAFTGFHFAMVTVGLLQQRKLNRLMSSYQVLRITLQYLATSDWTKSGMSLASPDLTITLPPLSSFHSYYEVVFLDSSGLLNLCSDMTKDSYRWLQHEASLAPSLLDDSSSNGFEALFMRPVPSALKFDTLCHISPANLFESSTIADPVAKEAILLDQAAYPLPLFLSKVLPVLHHGLEKRVKLVVVLPKPEEQWLPTKTPPDPNRGHVTLGLLLDTDHAFSILTMGPPADSPEAKEFRSFWGERSELRRFQDGSINEAVMWDGSGQEGVANRRTVCHQIIQYLLHRHASISPNSVTCTINALDPLLQLSSTSTTGEENTQKVLTAFTDLSKMLRNLRDLPLSINSLQGTSCAFRHTEVFPTLPWNSKLSSKLRVTPSEDSQSNCYYPSCDISTPPYIPVHEVVCQLEASGKWPDEVEGIAKIKTAFYIFISKALKEQYGLIASPTANYIDVMKDGYVFRLCIHYQRELTLLSETAGASTANTRPEDFKQKISEMKRTLVSLPVHTSSVNGLHQQHSAFGTGARLCKRWVSSHLHSNHLSDEAVELMVAYLFVSPAPYTIPSSPLCVLLRFLSLLSSHDWAAEPLVINFNNELSATDISKMVESFITSRSSLPSMVLATPFDKCPTPWTTPTSPLPPVAARLQILAKQSLKLLTQQLNPDNTDVDIRQAFRSPLQDYDVLIHLHKRHLPLLEQAVDAMATGPAQHSSSGTHRYTHLPVVNFDPVQEYLRELKTMFSEFAVFFYDKYGGHFIAVVWKPHAFSPQPFKVSQAHCRVVEVQITGKKKKSKGRLALVPDCDAILADFQILGEGLVKRVEVLSPYPTITITDT